MLNDTMRTLGTTDLRVAPLCLGGNVFGWTTDETTSHAVLDAYSALGGNFIDTADVYSTWVPGHSGGESEAVLGRWMQTRGNRAQIVLVTKVGSPMGPAPDQQGLSRRHITQAVEDSLRRLQTDYIDLYLAHRDDPNTPLEETLAAFTDLVQQGKVRAIGASNYSADRLAAALQTSDAQGYARYACLQPRYNLAARTDYEGALETLCRQEGLGVITYSALASGFLSGKYQPGGDLPTSPRAQNVASTYLNDRGFAVLAAVEQVAQAHGATASQVALAWQMARPGITAPIASATSVEQLRDLAGAADLRLAPADIATLEAVGQ